jgi:hypothetical protein
MAVCNTLPAFPSSTMSPLAHSPKDRQKKPRHRHSPAQLAALNELYDKDEHPSLDLRTSLAARLGMYVFFFFFLISSNLYVFCVAGKQRL